MGERRRKEMKKKEEAGVELVRRARGAFILSSLRPLSTEEEKDIRIKMITMDKVKVSEEQRRRARRR